MAASALTAGCAGDPNASEACGVIVESHERFFEDIGTVASADLAIVTTEPLERLGEDDGTDEQLLAVGLLLIAYDELRTAEEGTDQFERATFGLLAAYEAAFAACGADDI